MTGGTPEGGGFTSSTEIYSTTKLKWEYGVPLPSARLCRGISLLNNVFVIGMYENENTTDSTFIFMARIKL